MKCLLMKLLLVIETLSISQIFRIISILKFTFIYFSAGFVAIHMVSSESMVSTFAEDASGSMRVILASKK